MTGVTKAVVFAIVCGMVHIKEPLLLIVKSNLCGGSRFHFSLSEWSLTYVYIYMGVMSLKEIFILIMMFIDYKICIASRLG